MSRFGFAAAFDDFRINRTPAALEGGVDDEGFPSTESLGLTQASDSVEIGRFLR